MKKKNKRKTLSQILYKFETWATDGEWHLCNTSLVKAAQGYMKKNCVIAFLSICALQPCLEIFELPPVQLTD